MFGFEVIGANCNSFFSALKYDSVHRCCICFALKAVSVCTLGSLLLCLVLCTLNLMAEGVLHSTAQNVSLSQ